MTGKGGEKAIGDWLRTSLFNEVPMSICVIDRNFRIVEANEGFRRSYGPWKGKPCYEVYKGRREPCESCAAVKTFSDGRMRKREESRTDGTHYLVHMVPLIRDGGDMSYIVEMSTDITHVKRLEQDKREAERLAAVGETVAGIAHGMKNVLMGLEGGVYAVNTGIKQGNDARIARGWAMLEENIARISTFVKEFLDFAKGRTARVAPADPNRPARRVVELFQEKAQQAGIELRLQLQEGIPGALLDEEGIHSCLANLVSNALDACTVSDQPRGHVVTLSTRTALGNLIYEVADTGRGMDCEISRKVFSKFFSTKGSVKGTGLGLLTTKKTVHQHGGKVSFDSEEGRGSVFRIEIPLRAPPKRGNHAPN